jgi:hypothetical protein
MSQGEDQNPRTRGGARPGAGRKRKEPEEGFDYSRALKKSLLVEKAKLEMLEAAWSLEPFATGYFDKICFQALYWRAIDTRGDVMTFQDVERLVLEYFNKYWAFVDGKKTSLLGKNAGGGRPCTRRKFCGVDTARKGSGNLFGSQKGWYFHLPRMGCFRRSHDRIDRFGAGGQNDSGRPGLEQQRG